MSGLPSVKILALLAKNGEMTGLGVHKAGPELNMSLVYGTLRRLVGFGYVADRKAASDGAAYETQWYAITEHGLAHLMSAVVHDSMQDCDALAGVLAQLRCLARAGLHQVADVRSHSDANVDATSYSSIGPDVSCSYDRTGTSSDNAVTQRRRSGRC
jgi:DNA-binding PadR family transcriptional regulator